MNITFQQQYIIPLPLVDNTRVLVAMEGRALGAEAPEGDYWINGVNPGGMAEGGEGLEQAMSAFLHRLRLVLEDLAADSASVEVFRYGVEQFYLECDEESIKAWDEAASEPFVAHLAVWDEEGLKAAHKAEMVKFLTYVNATGSGIDFKRTNMRRLGAYLHALLGEERYEAFEWSIVASLS